MILYHGTRYADAIVLDGRIKPAPYGDRHVSLTLSWDVARHWALLERDGEDETAAVFEFDLADLLAAGHDPRPFASANEWDHEYEIAIPGDLDLRRVRYRIWRLA